MVAASILADRLVVPEGRIPLTAQSLAGAHGVGMSIKNWFKRAPAAPRLVEVGAVHVTVLFDSNDTTTMNICGEYRFTMDRRDYVTPARKLFDEWQDRNKATGMTWVGGGRYIATDRVREVQVLHEAYHVEVT
jgi:hypothetical protein